MKRNPLIFLARLEGFEPPTYGLEDAGRDQGCRQCEVEPGRVDQLAKQSGGPP